MVKTVAIGIQDFKTVIEQDCYYIDKTDFIKEWWESKDNVTLITRPRRFGKTLNMSMLYHFFSNRCVDEGYLFENLSVWKEEKYQKLQGKYPVIFLSFAGVKETTYEMTYDSICEVLYSVYEDHGNILEGGQLSDDQKMQFLGIKKCLAEKRKSVSVGNSLHTLSKLLEIYYQKKVIILLDEYDTPMQEAYVHGFWEELVAFTRSLFNAAFKTNPYLERAIMTGITRVSKESIFSDLNNLKVVTTTSDEYAKSFGFTETEVFAAMDEFGYKEKEPVKNWYDGFIFGKIKDIYNPWSILNYLDTHKFAVYWANTSSNSLVGKLLREGNRNIKQNFETLLNGESITAKMDEQVVYNQLDGNQSAVWSLLLASGYLKVLSVDDTAMQERYGEMEYELTLTNSEVKIMFASMIRGWFGGRSEDDYNDFIKALLEGDIDSMNSYMNEIALNCFSNFDSGNGTSSKRAPESFYHGFVLGLSVELRDRYYLKSNRESGFGRYDIMLEPRDTASGFPGIIIEFKVFQPQKEKNLEETLQSALKQIEEKDYGQELLCRGIGKDNIRKYGFAFQGKKVLIG